MSVVLHLLVLALHPTMGFNNFNDFPPLSPFTAQYPPSYPHILTSFSISSTHLFLGLPLDILHMFVSYILFSTFTFILGLFQYIFYHSFQSTSFHSTANTCSSYCNPIIYFCLYWLVYFFVCTLPWLPFCSHCILVVFVVPFLNSFIFLTSFYFSE